MHLILFLSSSLVLALQALPLGPLFWPRPCPRLGPARPPLALGRLQ